ncbi:hypothetical protein TNCV_1416481 [Trichonephila clavipes]|nr:hypothetical protein TNCV_1416481 [Trichonephila clavipes]
MWIEALSTAHIEQKNDQEIFAFPPLDRVEEKNLELCENYVRIMHLELCENVGGRKYKQTLFTICGTRFSDKPQTLDHLEDNIRRVIAHIRPQMLGKVIENWTSRLDYIRASRGSHMPEII